MLITRRKNFKLAVLALLGLAYFSAVSTLSINSFLRSEIILIPLQVLAMIYVVYGRSRGNIEQISSSLSTSRQAGTYTPQEF